MEHMDEKIITMMKELEAERSDLTAEEEEKPPVDTAEISEEASIDVSQPLVRIADELVPFFLIELIEDTLYAPLPRTFRLLTRQEASIKYPSEHRPSLIYSNDTGTVSLAFHYTTDPVPNRDIEFFTDTMIHVLRSVQPVRSWIGQGMTATNQGKPAGYCEFITGSLDGNLYHYMLFTELNGRALLCSFNCSEAESKIWKPVGKSILKAIQVEEEQKGV